MSFDLKKILESKRNLRKELAERPITEKLRMLNALRERALTIARCRGQKIVLHEPTVEYHTSPRRKKRG